VDTIAEHGGEVTPDRTQRLLNHAVWDQDQAQGVVRRFVVEEWGDQPLRVAALDESGQDKHGTATVGVKRQYMGCAGRVANGVNTVYCSYATPGGHGLVGARIYLPAGQWDDPGCRVALGIGAGVVFRTKPQLAQDVLADMIADETMPPWVAGDEVYGRSGPLRAFLQDNGIGYVMRVGCAFSRGTGSRPHDAGRHRCGHPPGRHQAQAAVAGLLGDRPERRTTLRLGLVRERAKIK
jgi:SRSO17 transposase